MGSTNIEELAIWLVAIGGSYVVYKVLNTYLETPSAAYTLRGPDSPSWLFGNDPHLRMYRNETLAGWFREYGATFAIHGFFGKKGLLVADTKAAAFILNRPNEFPKPRLIVSVTKSRFGDGLIAAEGLEHKKQRKVINPVFSPAAMRDISPMLMLVAQELRDEWKKQLSALAPSSPTQEIDVLGWAQKAALDMIGIAGFGYKFNSLHDSSNELACAFKQLTMSLKVFGFIGLLTTMIPALRHVLYMQPTKSNTASNQSMAVMRRIGSQMVAAKKAEAELLGETSSALGEDLLSVLVRANLKENASERLDDETLLAQISTFLLAGHESTTAAFSWGLYFLAKDQSAQKKLREEVLSVSTDSPSMDELHALPYLDKVVKELLRLTAPIPAATRVARDDILVPLAHPIVDTKGNGVNELFIRRGESVMIHIYASNTQSELWGNDALQFKPERFDKLPEAVSDIASLFANLSTFGAGPRGCVGWRMAVLEIKSLLFTLLRTFEFGIDPELEITGGFAIAVKPAVKGQEAKGVQLPLRVSLIET
ncbi:hypothetical protein FRB98_004240 [Tulasnella sp. 332]|nr:hypothetical protein FRB98_004240 [Tulasnella sp. 332]